MREGPPPAAEAAGVYVHFPFCGIRCSYCDFATVAGRDALVPRYLEALEREIRLFQTDLPSDVDTIFLGGGTPSRLTPEQLRRLLGVLHERFRVARGAEITLECNPEGLSRERLAAFAESGVTRFSIGVQSLDDAVLRRVGRAHDAATARRAVEFARALGGPQVNVDLIAGLPGEELERWPETMRRVADWGADHLSVYLIEIDKQTPLARAVRSGRTVLSGDEAEARAYERTVEVLAQRGFELYEISNFAVAGRVSRHNRKYWSDAAYGGFGLGAHAYAAGRRRGNRRDLAGYLEDLAHDRDPRAEEDGWDPARRLDEAVILGLRRVEGIDTAWLGRRYDEDLEQRYGAAWNRAQTAGLLARESDRVRLTARGRLFSNAVFRELLSD